MQKRIYHWRHIPSGKCGVDVTKREMTDKEFLSCMAWWNLTDEWKYWPAYDNNGILPQHLCKNTENG